MLLCICWVWDCSGEGEVSVGQLLWNSGQSCWRWLWLLMCKRLLFPKGHSFSTPWAHMISWTVWIFRHIMVQIKCLWPSVNWDMCDCLSSWQEAQKWKRTTRGLKSLDIFHHPATAPHFPRRLPSRAQSAPDTGGRGRLSNWGLGCSSVLLEEIFLCSKEMLK